MSPLEIVMWEVLSVILFAGVVIGVIVFVVLAMAIQDKEKFSINNSEKVLTNA